MDERVLQFRVGAVVLAAVLIGGLLIMIFGELPSVVQDRTILYVRFPEAPGVTVDTPVRKSGILIGRVRNVELKDEGIVLVTLAIDSKYTLRQNEAARIATGSLLGDAVIEFVPSGRKGASNEPLESGDTIAGLVASDPLKVLVNLEGNMVDAMGSIEGAADEVKILAGSLNTTVAENEGQFQRVMVKSEQALDTINRAMTAIDEIVGDEDMKARLRQSLEDLPQLLEDSHKLVNQLDVVAQRADRNLANLEEGFTGPLRKRGPNMLDNIERSTRSLDRLLSELTDLSKSLNSPDGSIGQLIHNPDLYQKLDRAATNIQEVSGRMRPVVNDLRVFADKVARDPSRLGVKGALNRNRSGLK